MVADGTQIMNQQDKKNDNRTFHLFVLAGQYMKGKVHLQEGT